MKNALLFDALDNFIKVEKPNFLSGVLKIILILCFVFLLVNVLILCPVQALLILTGMIGGILAMSVLISPVNYGMVLKVVSAIVMVAMYHVPKFVLSMDDISDISAVPITGRMVTAINWSSAVGVVLSIAAVLSDYLKRRRAVDIIEPVRKEFIDYIRDTMLANEDILEFTVSDWERRRAKLKRILRVLEDDNPLPYMVLSDNAEAVKLVAMGKVHQEMFTKALFTLENGKHYLTVWNKSIEVSDELLKRLAIEVNSALSEKSVDTR